MSSEQTIYLVTVRIDLVDKKSEYTRFLQEQVRTSARALSNRVRSLSSLHHSGSEQRVMGIRVDQKNIMIENV